MHRNAMIGTVFIILLFIANVIYIGKKNLWFEPKNDYWTILKTAEGLREGTLVTFNGIKIGEISEMTMTDENLIRVKFTVRKPLAGKISGGASVRVSRSMMIGEKRLEILPGAPGMPPMADGSFVPGEDIRNLSDLLSGNEQLQQLMPQVQRLLNNIDIITTGLAENPEMMRKVELIMDEAYVLLKTLEGSWLFKGSYNNYMKELREKSEQMK